MEESKKSSDSQTNSQPTTPDLPVGTVKKLPHSGSSKKTAIFLTLFGIVFVACAGYYLANNNSTKDTATKEVKNDIPQITYSTGEKGYDKFYPEMDTSNNYIESNRMIFEGLVQYQDQSKVVPLLATSWTNPDSATWIFTLKKGVKFHTGRVMTAEDVKASFEAAKDSEFGSAFSSTLKTVTVMSANEIKIVTDGPDPLLLNRLTNLWIFDTKSEVKNDPINGTGPYVMKPNTIPGNERLELIAYDAYHGGHVFVRAFTFVSDDTTNVFDQYNAGKYNVIGANLDRSKEVKLTRDHKTSAIGTLSVFHMPLNTTRKNSPLANLKVRQAILLGTDPAAVAEVRNTEFVPAGQILPPTIPGYNPEISRPKTDVVKAKELLAEAGYPNGFTITYTYFAPSKTTADEIARQFKAMNITLKLDPRSKTSELADIAFGGKTDMFSLTASSDIFDGSDVMAQYYDGNNYKNPVIAQLLIQANQTLDRAEHLKILQKAAKLGAEDVATIPYYYPAAGLNYYDSKFVLKRDIPGSEVGIYFWKVYSK